MSANGANPLTGPPRRFRAAFPSTASIRSPKARQIWSTRSRQSAFFSSRGCLATHYAKELADRVIVTWDVTEPWGNIQDFTWTKTINRFQAVLHKDGAIEMSYQQLAAKDAIIGVYPLVSGGNEKPLATLAAKRIPPSPRISTSRICKLSVVDGLFLKVTFETAGPVLPEGDAGLSGIAYHVYFNTHKRFCRSPQTRRDADAVWTIRGFAPRRCRRGQIAILCVSDPASARRVNDERQHHFDSGNPSARAP